MGLKGRLRSAPVLAFLDVDPHFIFDTGASSVALRAVLARESSDGRARLIHYTIRPMSITDRSYAICEQEELAVIFGLCKFRHYLSSDKTFTVISGFRSLKYAFSSRDIHGQLARLMEFLAEYDMNVNYRQETKNNAANHLSRYLHEDKQPRFKQFDEGELVNFAAILDEVAMKKI